jgi:hypothetical protein
MWVEYPTILDDQKPRIKAYTIESAIAEKYHAMVDLNLLNSRMKDFFDIYYLSSLLPFEGERLMEAITKTFKRRKTELPNSIPAVFTDAYYKNENTQTQWQAFHKKLSLDNIPIQFKPVILRVKEFLWKITKRHNSGDSADMKWDPKKGWM